MLLTAAAACYCYICSAIYTALHNLTITHLTDNLLDLLTLLIVQLLMEMYCALMSISLLLQ